MASRVRRLAALLLVAAALSAPGAARADARRAELVSAWLAERAADHFARLRGADRVEAALADGLVPFDDARLARDVAAVYRRNKGRLVFLAKGGALGPQGDAVAALLDGVERHGLGSLPYRLDVLAQRRQRYGESLLPVQRPRTTWVAPSDWTPPGPRDPLPPGLAEAVASAEAAVERHLGALRELDVHLVAGLTRFVRDTAAAKGLSGDALARQVLAIARDPAGELAAWLPGHPQYERLTAGMARWLELWRGPAPPTVPADAPITPGDRGGAIGSLRARLAWEGLLPEPGPAIFDDAVTAALKRFQWSRGLPQSGLADDPTVRALNRPPEWWVRHLVLALRRWRESEVRAFAGTYARVNIPEYRIEIVEGGQQRLAMDVLVGMPQTRTYELVSVLREFRVNPRWNVPAAIARREIESRLSDRGWLEENGFVPRERGSEKGWIQRPGPRNWLGRVIVPFFNQHELALHGTLRGHLLPEAQRAFSNGCVNLADEVAFARYLLAREDHPALAQLDGWLEGWTTRTVKLRKPLPLVIEYQTVAADEDGLVRFLPDIYRKDHATLSRVRLDGFDRPGVARQP
jgi:hypothetical protein